MITSVMFLIYKVNGAVSALLICAALLLIGICALLVNRVNRTPRGAAIRGAAIILAGAAAADGVLYFRFFRAGEYIDRGMAGVWTFFMIYAVAVALTCIGVTVKNQINRKKNAVSENSHG